MHKWQSQSLVLRICFNEEHQVDWNVSFPDKIAFQDVIDVISQASNDLVVVTAFEYEDEDGDRITVRTDQELKTMIVFHTSFIQNSEGMFVSDEQSMNYSNNVLLIYPKLTKPSNRRNVHGLKVAIAPTASSLLLSDGSSVSQQLSNTKLHQTDQANLSHQSLIPGGPEHYQTVSTYSQSSTDIPATGSGMQCVSTNSEMEILKDSLSFQIGKLNNDTLTFLETLGNGNSGVVRKALHKETQIITAVKSITLDLTGEEQKRILQELEILKRCNGSPYIIAFFGAFFDENRVLLCTEYMDGGSLDKYGAVSYPVLRNVACAIAHGLQHLWLLRIMHRDVKPSNILINTDGFIKLCDFGVSTQLVDSIARTYVGTNAYMAPERVIGHDYTIYSDVWSFGLSLCELATGEFPYPQLACKIAGSKGIVPMEVMQCIVNDAAPRLSPKSIPPDICDFVTRCLQKEAESRLLPEQLCLHPLVTSCLQRGQQESLFLVSEWIKSKLKI